MAHHNLDAIKEQFLARALLAVIVLIMPRSQSHGRIRPHQRDTNDETEIIGAGDIVVLDEHTEQIRVTEDHGLKLSTRKDYRLRIRHIYMFLQESYPEYCERGGVVELVGNEQTYHHTNTHDLKYVGMNVELIKAFLGHKKIKINGKTSSFTQMRKYYDAILWGATSAKEQLPTSFYVEMDKWMNAYRKETKKAAKDGNLDENEADPVPFTLFRLWMTWSLESRNVYVWVFGLLQWNLMARSISVGTLAFHNFRPGEDNIIIKYDNHKADQAGESLHDKHLFSNPFDPVLDLYLGLAVWLAIDPTSHVETEDLFLNVDTHADAASQRFCSQLNEILRQHRDILAHYIRPNHANTHSIRKGSGTYSQSGTTCPPPATATAGRGEWSLGRVFDLYLHLADPADTYLGRILVGLDPNNENFATLPPHFVPSDPMANEFIREAMDLMYGPILTAWRGKGVRDITAILLRVLPSVVHHSDFLDDWMRRVPGHPFSSIPLLHRRDLLLRLKGLVTTKATESMKVATGIPPHIEHARQMKKCIDLCSSTLGEVKNLKEEVKQAVVDAYENRAAENGHMTADRMCALFQNYELKMSAKIDSLREEIERNVMNSSGGLVDRNSQQHGNEHEQDYNEYDMPFADGEPEEDDDGHPLRRCPHRLYSHGGKLWHVPESFQLQVNIPLRTAVRFWLEGMPGYQTTDKTTMLSMAAPIRPFRLFKLTLLPPKVRRDYKLHWLPIMKIFFQMTGVEVPVGNLISSAEFESIFDAGLDYLKTSRMSYVFGGRKKPLEWKLSTWAKHSLPSMIQKYGSPNDQLNLPTLHRLNAPRTTGSHRRRSDQQQVDDDSEDSQSTGSLDDGGN